MFVRSIAPHLQTANLLKIAGEGEHERFLLQKKRLGGGFVWTGENKKGEGNFGEVVLAEYKADGGMGGCLLNDHSYAVKSISGLDESRRMLSVLSEVQFLQKLRPSGCVSGSSPMQHSNVVTYYEAYLDDRSQIPVPVGSGPRQAPVEHPVVYLAMESINGGHIHPCLSMFEPTEAEVCCNKMKRFPWSGSMNHRRGGGGGGAHGGDGGLRRGEEGRRRGRGVGGQEEEGRRRRAGGGGRDGGMFHESWSRSR